MTNQVRKMAEVEETTWTLATGKIVGGIALVVVALALIYVTKFLHGEMLIPRILLGLVALAGLGLVGAAIYEGVHVRKKPAVAVECPYCDKINTFEGQPSESYDCEHCSRTVHYENGVPVEVRTVTCPFCQTEHRVATNVHRYVCDQCNRPLEVAPPAPGGKTVAAQAPGVELPGAFDVLLIAADRRHEIEVAMKLQNILVVNLAEARRLMASASAATPVVVSQALPQRKAEAIRRQLQDVGATATLRPVGEVKSAPGKKS